MTTTDASTPWLDVTGAATYLLASEKTIYRLVRDKKLRAARIGGGRCLRFRAEWLDAYLDSTAAIVEINAGHD
jgi:excisionase family DNA binding protein